MKLQYIDIFPVIDNSSVKDVLSDTPHKIVDANGTVISEKNDLMFKPGDPVVLGDNQNTFGFLYAPEEYSGYLKQVLTAELWQELEHWDHANQMYSEDCMNKDLDKVIQMAADKTFDVFEVVEEILLRLRSHIPLKQCSIYIEHADKELHGLCGLSAEGKFFKIPEDARVLGKDTLGGVSYYNQSVYIIENPRENSAFKELEDHLIPINFACFPLKYHNFSIGVLNISNNMLKKYSEKQIETINRFLVPLEHVLFQEMISGYLGQNKRVAEDLKFYVSNNLYETMVKQPEQESIVVPEKKYVVALFADIRSFTRISEPLDPKLLVDLLNFYFENLSPIIEESGGTIDKFVGDMISCFWNAPKDIENPEAVAINCAIKMQKTMVAKVAVHWANHGVRHMGIGVGINAGNLLVGQIGSKSFNNYTIMGESATKANWLESLARPAEIWVSENTAVKAGTMVPQPSRKDTFNSWKGKKQKIYVYKPEDYPDYTK